MADTKMTTSNDDNSNQAQVFDGADGPIRLDNADFISNAALTREGFDLTMTLENGESVVIEGYFAADPAPMILSEGGMALTPQLVNSFVSHPHFAEAGTETDASPVGAVKEISGEATVTRTDGSVETISLGMPIYEGDVIETSAEGAVNMIFIDETEFAVSEDARLAIDEYVFDADTAEGTTNFSILRGVFVFTSGIIGRDDPDDVEIDTPVGSIGIRGTIIAGKIDPEGNDTQITVIEGAIVIRNGLGETTLSNQFETVQLASFESEILNLGTLDAGQMNQNFGSVSGVSASLFSAINDSGSTTNGPAQTQGDDSVDTQGDAGEETDGTTEGEGAVLDTSEDPAGETEGSNVKSGSGLESKLDNGETGITQNATPQAAATYGNTDGAEAGTGAQQSAYGTTTSTTGSSTTTVVNSTDNPYNPVAQSTVTGASLGSGIYKINDAAVFASRGIDIPRVFDTGIGASIAGLGDIDGDGRADFAFVGDSGELFIYDSLTGSVAETWLGGIAGGDINTDVNIAAGGDINADGEMDLIVGMPQADGVGTLTGQISIFDATNTATNSQITNDSLFLTSTGSIIGQDVVLIGDIDADGHSDYALGFDENANGDGGVLIKNGAVNSFAGGSDTIAFDYIAGSTGELLGVSLHAAGDLNNDGFDDLVAGTDNGSAYVIMGGTGPITAVSSAITAPGGVTNFGKNVLGGSDLNRDGHSDLLITSMHATYGEVAHLYSGLNFSFPQTTFYSSRTGWETVAGAMLGDTNGDGIDDFAITTSNGVDSETFLIYGRETGLPSQIDLNFNNLTSFNPAFGQVFIWEGTGSAVELGRVGDINGDGLDDLAIGARNLEFNASDSEDGAIKVVYGQAYGTVVKDGSVLDGDLITSSISATANDQALLGDHEDNIFTGLGLSGLSVSGGNGNDRIELSSAGVTHKTINGGGGNDRLFLTGDGGVLDFTSSGAIGMSIAEVEHITMNGNSNTLRLDFSDLFDLMRDSHDNTLRIDAVGASNQLQIVRNGADLVLSAEGFTGETLGTDVNTNGYYDLNFGGYTLLIDTNITAAI